MNIPRLTALSARLRHLPEDFRFNIGPWTSCAGGVATRMAEFNLLGLDMVEASLLGPNRECVATGHMPSYGHFLGWAAIEEFFYLTTYQAAKIFHSSSYPSHDRTTPEMVADAIDRLIGKEPVSTPIGLNTTHQRGGTFLATLATSN